MKAIILAAGVGSRLRPITDDKPKCLVELGGKSLLDFQLEVLRHEGVEDITLVAGYRAEQIERAGLRKLVNPNFRKTNMVATLFTARELLDGEEDVIVSYGDIIYESRVLTQLLACNDPLALTVDRQWFRYWKARMDDPLSDAETLRLEGRRVVELGKVPKSYEDIEGQYMGLFKVRADWVTQLVDVWDNLDRYATYDRQSFDNMYMTSFIQNLINLGWYVGAVLVDNGWLEVDTVSDLAFYERLQNNKESLLFHF